MEFLHRFLKKSIADKRTAHLQPKGGTRPEAVRLLSGYSWLIIALGVFLISSLWLFVEQQISYDYDRTIEETSQETMNLAKAFEEHVRSVVTEVDRDLLNLKAAYGRYNLSSPIFVAYAQNAAEDQSRSLVALYNEQGDVFESSIQNGRGMNRVDREYFLAHRDIDGQMIYIGRPIMGKITGQNTIPMTRRINKPNGDFGGIVYIGLKSNYFLDFYQRIDLGKDSSISLIGLDGFVRARRAGDNVGGGEDLSNSDFWKQVQSGPPCGTQFNNVLDGITRIGSYRVMPDYPLVVIVAKSSQVALAGYEQRKRGHILGALLVSLFILIFCGLLVNRAARQQALNKELEGRIGEIYLINTEMTAILESIRDPFIVLDKKGRLAYINKEAAQATKNKLSESNNGQNICELFPELVGSEIYKKYYEERSNNKPIHAILKNEVDERWFDTHLYPYVNGLLIYFRDVTEQKKYEAELSRLDRLNVIGEMAASIGHEVRNPMTTVRGYLQWFTQKAAFAEYRKQLALMIEELDRANSIITEYLSLAKNKSVELRSVDLNTVIRNLFPLLQAGAFQRGNTIELEQEDIPEVFVDEKEMRQCILNLVNNGLDAMPEGGKLTISTAKVENRVVMTVRDRGTGIPSEIKDKVGTPFFTTKENGTGLGLSICYQIAQRHNATIEMETGPEGTAFHFIFS